jgi:XTP/dITP diphosphohydrolase
MTQLWVATTNKDKFKEIKELLKELPIEVHAALELPAYSAPHESATTFEGNARIKARFLKAMRNEAWVLSDDSGLEVVALKGLPGVHSARYAGPNARDIENVSKLLKFIQLQTAGDDRSATFKCVLNLLGPNGEDQIFEGTLNGSISRDVRGKTGFGYDPVFIPEGETKTIGELGLAVKNKLSHRAKALREVKKYLQTVLTGV